MSSPVRLANLTQLVETIPLDSEETPEDIFAFAPGLLFTDDIRNQHGDPGATIVYHSHSYGDIKLGTADPEDEQDRRLFGHYLWNAGILVAERLSGRRMTDVEERSLWNVKGQNVLELGAGVGLSGIVAGLSGAGKVIMTDYPARAILDNIRTNVKQNAGLFIGNLPNVVGHEWGVFTDDFALANKHSFDCVLAADCFWMPHFHAELASSMLHFLSTDRSARVLAVGGFHTGRAKFAEFFDTAEQLGLVPSSIYEEDADGFRREWAKVRDGGREHVTERKKWLVIAVMRRKGA